MSPFLVLASLLLSVPVPPYWGDLAPGPFRAGFERLERLDYSRPYRTSATDADERARPIRMSIWYPALTEEAADEVAVRFEDYLGEDEGSKNFASRLANYGFALSPPAIEAVLAEPTAAIEKAPRAPGPFPVLLFATGLTGPDYLNTVICEYLATHGYLVVALASLPPREDEEARFDGFAVDSQMRDMEFALQVLHDYPGAATSGTGRLGLVAWSFGGVAQALLSMKNPDVAAVVSLDAATGYAYGWKLLQSSMFYDPGKATAPFFHATDSRESHQVPKSFDYFDRVVRGPAYLLTLEGATHAEFTSLASVIPRGAAGADSESKAVAERYFRLCLYVRVFLDEELKKDPAAGDFLDVAPTRHGFEGLVLSRKR